VTNHVSRARSWIAKSAAAAALTVLPLAAASVAEAATILPTSNTFFDHSGDGSQPNPVGTATQLAPDAFGTQGVRFDLTTPFSYVVGAHSAYGSDGFDINVFASGNAVGGLASGTLMPLSWSVGATSSGAITDGGLSMSIFNGTTGTLLFYHNETLGAGGVYAGTATEALAGAINNGDQLYISTFVYLNPYSNGTSVTFNTMSFQFNAVAEAEVPEPASILLALGAAAPVISSIRGRRRRSS